MKGIVLSVAAVLLASFLGAGALLLAHFDEPSNQIGEYQVRLNSLKVNQFDDGFLADIRPDLFIKTFTQAETHVGEVAAFGEFTDTPVGHVVGIGKLIYWHLDCPDSEKLQLIVDVADRDGGDFAPILKAALALGVGVLAKTQPGAGQAADMAGQALIKLIDAELSASDQFPQFSSDGFTIADDAGTIPRSQSAVGGIGMTGQYEFSTTFSYITRNRKCTDANLHKLQIEIAERDPEVRAIKERLANQAIQSGKATSQRAAQEGLTEPTAKLNYALGELDLREFLVERKENALEISLDSRLDEFAVLYMFGAAATAFVDTPVRGITVLLHDSRYRTGRSVISRFMNVPQERIGSGEFVLNLLRDIVVEDVPTPT
jgi:hypothetical protein